MDVARCNIAQDLPLASDHQRMEMSGASGVAYSVAVATKVQQSVKQQGKDALKLIDAATMGTSQLPPGVGENLNIKA